jgi:uncharacterized protein YihD (DUF1040 family)
MNASANNITRNDLGSLTKLTQSKGISASKGNLSKELVIDNTAMVNQAIAAGQRVYENTYKMKPNKKFRSLQVSKLTDEILSKQLKDMTYNAEKIPELTKSLANDILQGVKRKYLNLN